MNNKLASKKQAEASKWNQDIRIMKEISSILLP
jgi:hypothetical protein